MPQQTHDLTFVGDKVVKCYRHWDRGEPDREWTSLTLLAQTHPGLAPMPLERRDVDGRPAIVMSRLPGLPLGAEALTADQSKAVGNALRRLHEIGALNLPELMAERLTGPSTLRPVLAESLTRDPDLSQCADPSLVAEAVAAARDGLSGQPLLLTSKRVLGRADGNLANCLWDGDQVRLVDFEDAGGSEAAFEVADYVEHISFRETGGDPAVAVQECGLDAAEAQRCWEYRKLFATFWLVMLLPGNRGFSRNPPGTTESQARHVLALISGSGSARTARTANDLPRPKGRR